MQAAQQFPVFTFKSSVQGLPFEVRSLQDMKDDVTEKYEQPHSNDYFEITWIIRGSGTHWVDLHQCEIEDNQVFCIKPRQLHKTHFIAEVEGFVISFTDSFLNISNPEFDSAYQTRLSELFINANGILLKEEMLADMQEIVTKMMKEYDNIYLFKNEILKRYLKIFLIYLVRQFEENFDAVIQSRMTELVQNFMRLLDKHFREKKMVSEYAAELFVTPNYLNEIIKKQTGFSAGYHIRSRVALEAKRLALYSHISMKEISYRLGFLDPAHFSKFFKAINGINFSDFKKEKLSLPIAV